MQRFTANKEFGLLKVAEHATPEIMTVLKGEPGVDLGGRQTVNGEVWAEIQVSVNGWAPLAYLTEVTPQVPEGGIIPGPK